MTTLHLPKAQLKFKNFEGRETRWTPAGNRSFAIFFDEEALKAVPVGQWDIKFSRQDEDGKPTLAYIIVKVRYGEFEGEDLTPEAILTINGPRGVEREELTEDTIKTLDWAPFTYCAVTIHSKPWTAAGRSGVMAILDKIHAIVE